MRRRRACCAPRWRATPSEPTTRIACCIPCAASAAKGRGRFERIGWEEAIATVADAARSASPPRIPQQVLPYSYAGTMGLVQGESMSQRFFHRLGASLLDRTICATAGTAGHRITLGASIGVDVELADEAKLIIFWGCNAITSSVHFWARAQEAKRRGARLIAIDPYRSLTAEKCHEHIALLPGTDGALALGLMHVLIRDDLFDHDYVSATRSDSTDSRERVRGFDPAPVAAICGIAVHEIESLAHRYATHSARADPRELRPAASPRRRHGHAQYRLPAGAHRARSAMRRAASCCRPRGSFPIDRRALSRPDLLGARRAAHHQHVEHRPRAFGCRRRRSARSSSTTRTPWPWRPIRPAWSRVRARRSVHRGARAVPDRHGRLRRHRPAGDDAARAPRRGEALWALLHGGEQPGHPAPRRGETQHADIPPARAGDGLHRALLRGHRTSDRASWHWPRSGISMR